MNRNAWSEFNSEFVKTITNLPNHSRRVDEEADMVRMTRETHSAETLSVVKSLKNSNLDDGIKVPCQVIPHGLNPRFLCRSDEFSEVKTALDPQYSKGGLKVVAIHGLGVVGKTQLALHYANTSIHCYDVILWIPSETQIKMTQALSASAKKLGLPLGEDATDDYQAALKVKDWLNTAGYKFLLIFDNVDGIDILLQVWPASDTGSIIITTRSPSVALKRATKTIHLESFTQEKGPEALISLTGMKPSDGNEYSAAESICHLLGGLPLAISQISEFITDRGCSYEEFLSMYRRSAAKIHARGEAPVGYDHNLSTVWELSLQKLPEDAKVLQYLLAFLTRTKLQNDSSRIRKLISMMTGLIF